MTRTSGALVFSFGVMLLGALPSIALAKTIYVDLANKSGVEDGSPAHPFNTVTEGHSAAAAGDALIIRSGSYLERVRLSKAITVRSEGGTASILSPPPLAAVPLTLTITKVKAVGRGPLQDPHGPDLYAVVAFNARLLRQLPGGITCIPLLASFGGCANTLSIHQDDKPDIEPFWVFTANVPDGVRTADITIEIWEHASCIVPGCEADNQLDIGPDPAFPFSTNNDLHLTVDLASGRWTGDRSSPISCFTGDTDRAVQICWDISTLSANGDADGDGLLDGWERFGFDSDFDGVPDVDLLGLGAGPRHKDLFLELDWMVGQAPNSSAIKLMKSAFAAAPINAGGIRNPDDQPGINLHVDTGSLTDPTANEGAGGPASCSDGIDNDGDGLVDGADSNCLAGDNLGGGNPMPSAQNCGVDFYQRKAANFSPNRRWIYRYGISGNGTGCNSGGHGEIGGNDFIEFNHDGGTIMHELGHTLGLRHGGFENHNCKPNYVSVMNYDDQFGINQAGGGSIIDYSPPQSSVGGRGRAPLPTLEEDNLNEATILDATDFTNRFVFVNSRGQKVQNPLNQAVDWNGDGDTADSGLQVNIDTKSAGPNGQPAKCGNGDDDDELQGAEDWSRISLPFRQFGNSDDAAIRPVTEPEPTLEELRRLQTELNTTDLQLTVIDTLDPAIAGTQLTFSLTVTNLGPNPASQTQVVDTLPAGIIYQSDTGRCFQDPVGTLTCNLGEILARASKSITITVLVPADFVLRNGGPKTITNRATVSNLAGPDLYQNNNSHSQQRNVVGRFDRHLCHGLHINPQLHADFQIRPAGGGGQNNPAPQRHLLRRPVGRRPVLKSLPVRIRKAHDEAFSRHASA